MLLTRSPLGHLPEGRASLDLHVLSTPPAFVLSQDQTLRECFVWLPGRPRRTGVPTESSLVSTSCVLVVYQRNPPRDRGRSTTALSPRGRGLLALTFGTLLSSQGADAHRYWASRPFSGQLAKRYSAGFAVSNPEVWPHHPHITLGRGIRGVGGMGARPVRRSTGVRGVEHGRRAVAVESNPLSPLSRTAVRCPRRLSSTGAGRARRQAGGGARTRTKPTSTAAFHTS